MGDGVGRRFLRRLLLIAAIVIAIPLLAFVGLFLWSLADAAFFSLPANSPRVVLTTDYRFDAPDGWITLCANEAPGCIAVKVKPGLTRTWSNRAEWIEVQPVDSANVADAASFRKRAVQTAAALSESAPGADSAAPDDVPPDIVEGTEVYAFTSGGGEGYMRSHFVRFPSGEITRFTCHASDESHDTACAEALGGLHFPAAQALAVAREAERVAAVSAAAVAARTVAPAKAAARLNPRPATTNDFDYRESLSGLRQSIAGAQALIGKIDGRVSAENRRIWTGPGWYVADSIGRISATSGQRYESKAACLNATGAVDPETEQVDDPELYWFCEQISDQP